jgi:hypothetical protein
VKKSESTERDRKKREFALFLVFAARGTGSPVPGEDVCMCVGFMFIVHNVCGGVCTYICVWGCMYSICMGIMYVCGGVCTYVCLGMYVYVCVGMYICRYVGGGVCMCV